MTAKLHHEAVPHGPVLPLAKAIAEVSPKLGRNAVKIAAALFSGAHSPEEPATIEVEVADKLPALREVCAGCGIAVLTETQP